MENTVNIGNGKFKIGDRVRVIGIPGPSMAVSCFVDEQVKTIWFSPGEYGRWDGPYYENFDNNILEKC